MHPRPRGRIRSTTWPQDLSAICPTRTPSQGRAADFAREDLNARLDQHNAREALPRAWAQLVEDEVDDRLASLLTAAASSLTEASPVRRDVAEFLRNLKPDSGRRPPSRTASRRKRTADTKAVQGPSAVADADTEGVGATVPRRAVGATPRRSVPSEARDAAVRYWLLGEERFARNAKEAYVAIFAALARTRSGFPDAGRPETARPQEPRRGAS